MKVSLFLKGQSFQCFGEFTEAEEIELLRKGYRKIYSINLKIPKITPKRKYETVQIGVNKFGIPIKTKKRIL